MSDSMNTQEKLVVLKKARELITPPEKWTTEDYGKDLRGMPISGCNFALCVQEGTVSCFCSLGAIRAAGGFFSDNNEVTDVLESIVGEWEVDTFNDTHTHEEVLALFDQGIAKLEKGEV